MNEHTGSTKLRGWLALFAAAFVAFLLLNGSALIDSAWNRTNRLYPPEYPEGRIATIHQVATVATFGRLAFLLVGVYVIWLLYRRDRRLVRFFTVYGLLFLPFEVFIRARYFFLGGFMSEGNTDLYWKMTALRIATVVVGFVSLRLWARAPLPAPEPAARAISDRSIAPAPPARGSWFWIGSVMVAWPFLMELFVDPTQWIGGLLVPTAISEGAGLAFAIQVLSVVTGLLVLMKLAFRMRPLWIFVLFPIFCGLLLVAYTFIGFMLHFTF